MHFHAGFRFKRKLHAGLWLFKVFKLLKRFERFERLERFELPFFL